MSTNKGIIFGAGDLYTTTGGKRSLSPAASEIANQTVASGGKSKAAIFFAQDLNRLCLIHDGTVVDIYDNNSITKLLSTTKDGHAVIRMLDYDGQPICSTDSSGKKTEIVVKLMDLIDNEPLATGLFIPMLNISSYGVEDSKNYEVVTNWTEDNFTMYNTILRWYNEDKDLTYKTLLQIYDAGKGIMITPTMATSDRDSNYKNITIVGGYVTSDTIDGYTIDLHVEGTEVIASVHISSVKPAAQGLLDQVDTKVANLRLDVNDINTKLSKEFRAIPVTGLDLLGCTDFKDQAITGWTRVDFNNILSALNTGAQLHICLYDIKSHLNFLVRTIGFEAGSTSEVLLTCDTGECYDDSMEVDSITMCYPKFKLVYNSTDSKVHISRKEGDRIALLDKAHSCISTKVIVLDDIGGDGDQTVSSTGDAEDILDSGIFTKSNTTVSFNIPMYDEYTDRIYNLWSWDYNSSKGSYILYYFRQDMNHAETNVPNIVSITWSSGADMIPTITKLPTSDITTGEIDSLVAAKPYFLRIVGLDDPEAIDGDVLDMTVSEFDDVHARIDKGINIVIYDDDSTNQSLIPTKYVKSSDTQMDLFCYRYDIRNGTSTTGVVIRLYTYDFAITKNTSKNQVTVKCTYKTYDDTTSTSTSTETSPVVFNIKRTGSGTYEENTNFCSINLDESFDDTIRNAPYVQVNIYDTTSKLTSTYRSKPTFKLYSDGEDMVDMYLSECPIYMQWSNVGDGGITLQPITISKKILEFYPHASEPTYPETSEDITGAEYATLLITDECEIQGLGTSESVENYYGKYRSNVIYTNATSANDYNFTDYQVHFFMGNKRLVVAGTVGNAPIVRMVKFTTE